LDFGGKRDFRLRSVDFGFLNGRGGGVGNVAELLLGGWFGEVKDFEHRTSDIER
jgi:hypothetical protein